MGLTPNIIKESDEQRKQPKFSAPRRYVLFGLTLLIALACLAPFSHLAVRADGNDYDDGTDTPTAACTDGFVFRLADGVTNVRLTAGHCPIPDNSYWNQYSGSVDAMLIQQDDLAHVNSIFQTPNGPVFILQTARWEDISVGMTVCTDRGPSGIRCGEVLRMNYPPSYVRDKTETFLYVNAPCVPGDSGSPWFGLDTKQAIGITSGYRNDSGLCILTPLPAILDVPYVRDTIATPNSFLGA